MIEIGLKIKKSLTGSVKGYVFCIPETYQRSVRDFLCVFTYQAEVYREDPYISLRFSMSAFKAYFRAVSLVIRPFLYNSRRLWSIERICS